jgi:hypothetical protein
MSQQRTRAILEVLQRGGEDKLSRAVMKIFGASSLEECSATYEMVGNAERRSLDEAVERVAADGSAVFWLRVESETKV